MKNVLQGFRDLPDYPLIAIRLIAFWFVIFGIGNLIVGRTVIFPNQYPPGQKYPAKDLETLREQLIPISSQISFIQGMTPLAFEVVMGRYSRRLFYPETPSTLADDVYPGEKNSGGYIIIFWGVLYLVTALLLIGGFRRTTLLILAVWIIYGCIVMTNFIRPMHGLPLFSDDIRLSNDPSMGFILEAFKPPLLSVLVIIVIPLFIGALMILDERLKAYFKKGEFAERYRAYRAMRRSGGKNLHSLWTMEKKS